MNSFANKFKFTSILCLSFCTFFIPVFLSAQTDFGGQIALETCKTGDINQGGCGFNDLIELINNIVRFLVYISISVSVIAFAYAGFLYLTSFGDHGKVEEAHNIFKKSALGIFIVLAGWLIVVSIIKVLSGGDTSFFDLFFDGSKVDVNIVD